MNWYNMHKVYTHRGHLILLFLQEIVAAHAQAQLRCFADKVLFVHIVDKIGHIND